MQTRDELSRILPTPRVSISGYANTGKRVFYCFYKIFLKINSTNEENLFINFVIQKDFLNTRSRQPSFLLTNQNAHPITHEPMKFSVTKVKSKVQIVSEQASIVWMKGISALNLSKSLGEMSKVRWKQKKYSKDLWFCKERTSRWIFFFKFKFCLRNGLFTPPPPTPASPKKKKHAPHP